ncbi:MAG: N-6 DNA methylase [Proteobacteria bacterium]|nr:N-6 DNA methylase [Pseudomonadota bacterium]
MVPAKLLDSQRHAGPDRLGRYYTKADIGRLLIDQMSGLTPSRLLDLGAGGGSLSGAAIKHWSNIELLTVDIDERSLPHLSRLFHGCESLKHSHIRADALSQRLPQLIHSRFGHIDTAVCNPPFITPKWRKGFAMILEEAGFSGCMPVLSDVDAAVLFLAQNLRLLSTRATLGIILPDSLISAAKYRQFRKELLRRYCIHRAIRLPRGSFSNTDALAHIVILSKGSETATVPLQKLTNDRTLAPALHVGIDDAAERLDFDYHAHKVVAPRSQNVQVSLGSLTEELWRGSLSRTQGRLAEVPVLHTSDIRPSDAGKWCDLSDFGDFRKQLRGTTQVQYAEPGDILVARVGRNLERKVIGVSAGFPLITDCVYRLKVPEKFRDSVLSQLSNTNGQAWLASRAYGVGAKQLTKVDLLTFPLFL